MKILLHLGFLNNLTTQRPETSTQFIPFIHYQSQMTEYYRTQIFFSRSFQSVNTRTLLTSSTEISEQFIHLFENRLPEKTKGVYVMVNLKMVACKYSKISKRIEYIHTYCFTHIRSRI